MLKKKLEHIIAIEFILFSGGVKFFMANQSLAMLIMLLTTVLWFAANNWKIKKSISFNLKLAFTICIWVCLNVFFINPDIRNKSYLIYIILPITCCGCISFLNFYRFRTLYFRYLTILSAVSIVVQLLHDYLGIGTTEFTINNITYHLNYGIFNTEWGTHRLSSIYWEPGQYQIVINYCLCLFVDELRDLSKWRNNLKKFSVLIIALMMTQSTTGYLTFMLLLFSILIFPKAPKKPLKVLISLTLGCIISYTIFTSNAVQNKLNQESYGDQVSYNVRVADNLGCLKLAIEKPFFGAGISTKTASKKLTQYDSITSSNGWLFNAASLGFIYPLFILIILYYGIRRINYGLPTILIWGVLVIAQANESFTMLPYMWMFVFKYASYNYLSNKYRYGTKTIP